MRWITHKMAWQGRQARIALLSQQNSKQHSAKQAKAHKPNKDVKLINKPAGTHREPWDRYDLGLLDNASCFQANENDNSNDHHQH